MEALRQHIEASIHLTDEQYEQIRSYFSPQFVEKGSYLIRVLERVPYMYFVVTGLLKLYVLDSFGKQHILSFPREDWWETDYKAFINKGRAQISLQALEDTVVWRISLKDYHSLCS